jgi:outer membrane receptor protein involved in Fe transport
MQQLNIKLIISVLVLVFSFQIASAQRTPINPSNDNKTGIIKGRLVGEKSKEPVEYASIALYNQADSSLVTGVISKPNGGFIISKVKPGTYYIRITFIGFERVNIGDIVIDKDHSSVNLGVIKMKHANAELSAVDIVAEQAYVEYKIDKKVVNVANNLDAAGGNAVDALENVPSVSVDIDGNVSLRGSENFQVLINGKPSPLSASDALQQIPSAAIKNIEIITNPSAKYDPDGMTGIVNVILKDDVQQGVNGLIEAGISSFNSYTLNTLINYRKDKLNFFGGVNARLRNMPGGGSTQLENFINPDTTFYRDGTLDRERRRDNYTFKAGVDYYANDKNTFSIEGSYILHKNAKEYTTNTYEYSNPADYDLYKISDNTGGRDGNHIKGSLNWTYKDKKKKEELVTMLYYSNGDENKEEDQMEYLSNAEWVESGSVISGLNTTDDKSKIDFRFKMDYTKKLKKDSKFEAGIQSRNYREKSNFLFNQFDTLSNEYIFRPDYSSKLTFNRDIYSVYGTYGGMYKTFGYQLGLRGEYTNRYIESELVNEASSIDRFDIFPTVHLSQKLGKTNEVMASYSRRIDRPGGWELDPNPIFISSDFVRVGNIALEPEYTDNFELSYHKNFKASFVSLEGYYRTTKNKITRLREIDQNNVTYMTFANLDRDHSAGVEAMLNYRITKWMKMTLTGNYYYYKIEANEEAKTEERQSNNFNMNGNLNFNITKMMRLQLTGFYRGPSVTAQGDIAAFTMMNAALRYDFFNHKLAATFKVRDIFQTMKHEFASYTETFNTFNSFNRQSPTFSLTLSYRINNYKQKRKPSMGDGEGGMEGDI